MNEVKAIPCWESDASCRSRTRRMCSTLCWFDSPNPITLVALVVRCKLWASSITLSQLAGSPFFGETSFRTSSTNISAPPPGKPCIPAAFRRVSTSSVERLLTSAIPSISIGLKQSIAMLGWLARMWLRSSSYHSKGKAGFTPPCIRIRTPPISSRADIRPEISSKLCV